MVTAKSHSTEGTLEAATRMEVRDQAYGTIKAYVTHELNRINGDEIRYNIGVDPQDASLEITLWMPANGYSITVNKRDDFTTRKWWVTDVNIGATGPLKTDAVARHIAALNIAYPIAREMDRLMEEGK
jgi:hypothetical protein